MSRQTIIVGGGAIGLSIAWELSRRGVAVTLIERESSVGRATSWAASGILPPANLATATDPIDRLRGLSHQLFPEWTDQLTRDTGVDTGFRRCGGWYLADRPGERASMIGMTHYWRELEIECDPVTVSDLRRRESELRFDAPDSNSVWWVPDECQIRSPDYLRALHAACTQRGVDFITGAPVDDLRWDPDGAGVRIGDHWIEGDRVVVCGGAWSGLICEQLQLRSSLIPVRGQILMLKSERPLLKSVVNVGHRYLLCRDDGYTLIGSCEEEVGFTPGTTASMLDELRQFAVNLVPRLADAPQAAAWSGLRPMTFDGFPMIGRLPDTDNVFVAAGHFRSGIHLSPGTAVTLADLMTGQTPPVGLDAFRVGKQQSLSPSDR